MGERKKKFLKRLSGLGKPFLWLAIFILAVEKFFYYICVYARKGFWRYAFACFVTMSFAMESSFSYPEIAVAQEDTSGEMAVGESEIALARDPRVQYDSLAVLVDEAVPEAEGCAEVELAGGEEVDRYSLDEILSENQTTSCSTSQFIDEKRLQEGFGESEEETLSFDGQDWRLVLINKQHPIPEDYSFTLETIKTQNGGIQCDSRAMEDLFSMLQAADADEINLAICSHYRDINRQEVLFNRKIKNYMKKGMSYMEAYKISSKAVTVPGASEHQIGLAIDIVADNYTLLEEGFAETEAGIWLKEHCAEYGYILRYPKGKEDITGISFEPWHFRYVGKEAAAVIMEEEICLEEFWEKYVTISG